MAIDVIFAIAALISVAAVVVLVIKTARYADRRNERLAQDLDFETDGKKDLPLALILELLALALSTASSYFIWYAIYGSFMDDNPAGGVRAGRLWLLCRFGWIVLTVMAIIYRKRCSWIAALSIASVLADVYIIGSIWVGPGLWWGA